MTQREKELAIPIKRYAKETVEQLLEEMGAFEIWEECQYRDLPLREVLNDMLGPDEIDRPYKQYLEILDIVTEKIEKAINKMLKEEE